MSAGDVGNLFLLAQAGDKAAYHQSLTKVSEITLGYLARRIANPTEREDILQEILISVHKARHTYDGARPFLPWLFAIIKFRLTDHLRAHYAKDRKSVDIEKVAPFLTEDVTETTPLPEAIEVGMAMLPPKHKQMLHLLHVEGFTAKEVASKLGMNESAVKVATHRIYKKLRALVP